MQVPFGRHQEDDFKYTHAGSVSYTTHFPQFRGSSSVPPRGANTAKTRGRPRLSSLPRDGARGKLKCQLCDLIFTSARALESHKSASAEHQENRARMEAKMLGSDSDAERAGVELAAHARPGFDDALPSGRRPQAIVTNPGFQGPDTSGSALSAPVETHR